MITRKNASCLGPSNEAGVRASRGHRVVVALVAVCDMERCSVLQACSPKVNGKFSDLFLFHPKCRDFRILSNIMNFQGNAKYLLKARRYRCSCEKSSGCGGAVPPARSTSRQASSRPTRGLRPVLSLCTAAASCPLPFIDLYVYMHR